MTRELSCPNEKRCAHGPKIRVTSTGACFDCGRTLRNAPYRRFHKPNHARAVGTEAGYQGGLT
jgi:hypothetical protein